MAAPASAVTAATGAAFDEAIALTRRLKLPHIRREHREGFDLGGPAGKPACHVGQLTDLLGRRPRPSGRG
jgi:hypothetical protein